MSESLFHHAVLIAWWCVQCYVVITGVYKTRHAKQCETAWFCLSDLQYLVNWPANRIYWLCHSHSVYLIRLHKAWLTLCDRITFDVSAFLLCPQEGCRVLQSLCLYVCGSVCPLTYFRIPMSQLHKIFHMCYLCLWLSLPLTTIQ